MENKNNKLETDTPYVYNEEVPVWIVPISGWGSEGIKNAHDRMRAYLLAAEILKVNIEFTSRLGTFQSYKNAPSVSNEISAHNNHTFAAYDTLLGTNWRTTFYDEMTKHLGEK